jgi:hypothetical protein
MFTIMLLIAAFILFVLAAVGVTGGKINLLAAGLACWVLTQMPIPGLK